MLFFALEERAIFKKTQTRWNSARAISVTCFEEVIFAKENSVQGLAGPEDLAMFSLKCFRESLSGFTFLSCLFDLAYLVFWKIPRECTTISQYQNERSRGHAFSGVDQDNARGDGEKGRGLRDVHSAQWFSTCLPYPVLEKKMY